MEFPSSKESGEFPVDERHRNLGFGIAPLDIIDEPTDFDNDHFRSNAAHDFAKLNQSPENQNNKAKSVNTAQTAKKRRSRRGREEVDITEGVSRCQQEHLQPIGDESRDFSEGFFEGNNVLLGVLPVSGLVHGVGILV